MSSRGKRSSILKKRPSVPGPGSVEASPTETSGGTVKVTKRIGFKPKKSVKEFFATDETMTVWCNSYEVSADGTPPHLTINDTTLKDISKANDSHLAPCDQKNKENIATADDRRSSPNNSSIWNLSISTCEDEKRRMKAEVSVNSSVLNSTERLTQEPVMQTRGALRQMRQEQVASTSAMDVSPAKCEGKLSSPRKTIYFHPQQNMFITIDDVVPNNKLASLTVEGRRSPNETDINFYGPGDSLTVAGQGSVNDAAPAKILFQTSNVLNPYRNKSIQTEPRPSMVDKRSIAVHADLSAGWNSHIASAEPFAQRYTFGNSQFDISEAWNSHPAAALKLKMLQQGLISQEFDPRMSDGGGGLDDIDSTIAITQTVAKMLGPGSRPVSLESTRLSVPDAMDATNLNPNKPDEAMDISMQMDDEVQPNPATKTVPIAETLLEQSLNDTRIPPNALSRARPSFIPTVIPMDQSECSSPEVIVSVSGQRQRQKPEKQETILKTVSIDVSSTRMVEQTLLNAREKQYDAGLLSIPSPVKTPPVGSRRTNLNEENICVDDQLLKVVKPATVTPPRPPIRHTVYDANMDESHVELVVQEEKRSPRIQMQAINMDLDDLIFGRNSIGLELIKNLEVQQVTNRPKIHRMPPRMLSLDFGVTASARKDADKALAKSERVNEVKPKSTCLPHNATQQEVICLDSPDTAPKINILRKTVHFAADVSLEVDPLNISDGLGKQQRQTIYPRGAIEQSPIEQKNVAQSSRRTNVQSLDVTMESPLGGISSSGTSRPTIFTSENLDETVSKPIKTDKHLRPTMLFNENLDQSKLHPPSGSLEDLRKYGLFQETISGEEAMDFVQVESPRENYMKPKRETEFQYGEMEQSRLAQDDKILATQQTTTSRLTTIGGHSMDETTVPAPSTEKAIVGNKHRETFCFGSEMDQTDCYSRSVSAPVTGKKCRQTILCRESMEQTLTENSNEVSIPLQNSVKQLLQRVTIYDDENMDQTRNELRSQSLQTVVKENCDTGQIKRSLTPEMTNEPVFQKSRQTSFRVASMDETFPGDAEHKVMKDSDRSFHSPHKSRQTSFTMENMDQTVNSASKWIPEDNVNRAVQRSRASVFRKVDMEEIAGGGHRSSRFENEHSLPQQTVIVDGQSGEHSETPNALQKSCQTSFAVNIVNETFHETKSGHNLQKTCHTGLQEVDMDQTEPKRAITPTLSDLMKSSINENARKSPLQYGTDKIKVANNITKSRSTCFTLENMEQTMAAGCFESPISSTDRTSPRQSTLQQVYMEQTSMDKTRTPNDLSYLHQKTTDCSVEQNHSPIRPQSSHKARHTSHLGENMDQTIPRQQSPSLYQTSDKSRQSPISSTASTLPRPSIFQKDMEQTSRDKTLSPNGLSYLHQKTTDCSVEHNQSPLRPQSLHKSRHTSLLVQNMDQTIPRRRSSLLHQTNAFPPAGKSPQSPILQQLDMEQTSRDKTLSPIGLSYPHQPATECSVEQNHSPLRPQSSHKSRLTSLLGEHIDQTIPSGQSAVLHQTTAFPPAEKSRHTVHCAQDMDETLPILQNIPDRATLVASPRSRHTVYAPAQMDQTYNGRSPLITDPQSAASEMTQQPIREISKPLRHVANKRTTVHTREDMDETRRSVSPLAHFTSSLHHTGGPTCIVAPKVRQTIYQQDPMEETTLAIQQYCVSEKSRNTLLAVGDMNETLPQQRTSPYRVRHSDGIKKSISLIVNDEMPAEIIPSPIFSQSNQLFEEDMEQTTTSAPLRRAAAMTDYNEAENDLSLGKSKLRLENSGSHGLDCDADTPAEAYSSRVLQGTTAAEPTRLESETKSNRQTILVSQDMEESVVQSMEVSVIRSPQKKPHNYQNSRRTVVCPDNITEESFKKDIKLEQTGLIWNDGVSPEIRHEEYKTDFSFTMPQLTEDYVLRSSAMMPNRITNFSNHTLKPVLQAIPTEDSITTDLLLASRRTTGVRVPVDELSEISVMGDLTRLTRPTSFAVQGDISSVVLKELTEPTIVPPAVPVTVIQETPKKPSMIPVRRSRGTIFDRQPMDLDESGISPMVCEEKVDLLPVINHEDDHVIDIAVEKTTLMPTESGLIVRPEKPPERDSSDDEFYDAEANQEGGEVGDYEEEVVYIAREAVASIRNAAGRGNLKFIEVDQIELSNLPVQNQTLGGHKSLKFIDIDELEQTTNQKRHLSQISKSVLLEHAHDPLNISITEDYPLKKRKTAVISPAKPVEETIDAMDESIIQDKKSVRRVTFHQDLMLSVNMEDSIRPSESVIRLSDVETVMIKKECSTLSEDDCESEQNKMGQTILTDPSVFIVEDNDMLANESNISLVASPNIQNNNRGSTLKFDNTYYQDYVNLTLNIDQGGTSCIVISDDSITVPASTDHLKSTYPPAEVRLTLDDLPKRIDKTRESLVLNSTVASEVMYELKQQVSDAKKTCCSFQGNCNCRSRRTIAVVNRENVDMVRECWKHNFDRILESVSAVPSHDMPLDERINEILSRPMKPLPLSYLEKQAVHLPATPSIWFLCENYMKSLTLSDNPCEPYNPCDLPATPSVTALISNKLETEGYRWFLDSSNESQTHLYLRHCTLRTIQIKLLLQKPRRWYSKEEDIRIERLECTQCWQNTVRSPRLLAVHLEFMHVIDKMVLEQLCARYPTTAHLMSLIVYLDSLVEQVFGKVDQLYRIVRNNGAVLERFSNTDQLRIYKVFEYEREAEMQWNRVSLQFETIDRIEHTSVAFHRKMKKTESLYPTEQQCGKVGVRGLVFLECLLWNIEKFSK